MSTKKSSYIHGSESDEQDRLSLLNRLINDSSLKQIGLQPGDHVLDVGSGLGQFTVMMAEAVGPDGHVVGIERDPAQIARCLQLITGRDPRPEIREGDVVSLPLREDEWGTFDVAHARFLLEHLREPQPVVDAMVRAVRPGGRIILEDDDHDIMRFWPEPPGVADLWRAYYLSYTTLGNDPAIGRKLAGMLHTAGARPVRALWIPFGACAGEEAFLPLVENLIGVIQGAREEVLVAGLTTPEAFDNGIAALNEWSRLPDATLWYARAWAEGRKPAG